MSEEMPKEPMTYRNGMHIHQYVTINQAHQYMAIGDQGHALRDLYIGKDG